MKRFLSIFVATVFLVELSHGQLVSAAGAMSGTNKVTVYGKTTSTFTNVLLDNIIVTISFTDQGGSNPTPTITNNYLTILGWTQASNFTNAGKVYYVFTGTSSPTATTPTTTWTAGTNNPIIDITFSNGNAMSSLDLEDLTPTGGPTGLENAFWYFQIRTTGDVTNYAAKFYGTGAVNSSTGASLVPFQASLAPIALKDFNVSKQGSGNALLTWTTTFEQNASHFSIERSIQQSDSWAKIGEVKAKGNSSTDVKYDYTDANIYDGREVSKTVFYRLKEVDLDGTEKIFPVRSLKFSALGDKEITIFPNPARNGFYVQIPIILRVDQKVRLSLVNRLGQVVDTREITSSVANNYYYDISSPSITSGDYALDIIYDGQKLATKKIMVNR
jgi:hypothetical protein